MRSSTAAARRLALDWLPPAVTRRIRTTRRRRRTPATTSDQQRAAVPPAIEQPPAPAEAPPVRPADPRWSAITERALRGLETCNPVYRPTTYWGPGVQRLLSEMETIGVQAFKTWPEAFSWFYPSYGKVRDPAVRRRMARAAIRSGPKGTNRWLDPLIAGYSDAKRDYDVARMAWDQSRWPFDLESFGESSVGNPTQTFRLAGPHGTVLTKPYLNYLLCLAALSRHVDTSPRSFLELGGGYGVLGEIVLSRDADARYVNCDIPPLLTVSSYYLTELFGSDRVLTFDDRVADKGAVQVPQSACLPNWRIADVEADFDVFVNSFSFQEMEPHVVEQYVDAVARHGVRYVVSLNSRNGKHVQVGDEVGVQEQVRSAMIIELFERRGYELCATYNQPLIRAAGELAVLRRA